MSWFERLRLRRADPKVFGLGMSRTGTTSLTEALRALGFAIEHYPTDPVTIDELSRGECRLTLLRTHDGITDITTIPFYKQLDRAYPGSKFVLTVRDRESWLTSIEKLLMREPPGEESARYLDRPDIPPFKRMLRERVYGANVFDADAMTRAYRRHVDDVRQYFRERPDLLVLDIVGGDSMRRLCEFLSVPVVDRPFPMANAAP